MALFSPPLLALLAFLGLLALLSLALFLWRHQPSILLAAAHRALALGQLEDGERLFSSALRAAERLDPHHPSLGDILEAILLYSRKKGDLALAWDAAERLHENRVHVFGSKEAIVGDVLALHCDLALEADREDDLFRLAEEGWPFWSSDPPSLAAKLDLLRALAHLAASRKKEKECVLSWQERLVAANRLRFGQDAPETQAERIHLASLLQEAKEYPKAEALWRSLLPAATPLERYSISLHLAENLRLQDQPSLALPFYQDALALAQTTEGIDPQDRAALQNNYASVLAAIGRIAQAHLLFQQAFHEAQSRLTHASPALAPYLTNLADTHLAQGEITDTERLLLRAIALVEQAEGREAPALAVILDKYASLLQQTHQPQKAEQMARRARRIRDLHTG